MVEWPKYRQIMSKEIESLTCSLCERKLNEINAMKSSGNKSCLEVHHINGDHKDNRKENLVVVCKYCHKLIHKGIHRHRYRQEENNQLEKLKKYRSILLRERYNYSQTKIKELLDYEFMIACGGMSNWQKNRCFLCKSHNNLKYIINKLVLKYGSEYKSDRNRIACCSKCLKDYNLLGSKSKFVVY